VNFQEEWDKGLNVATLIFFADVFMIVVWLWLIPPLNSLSTAVNASHP
jgi:HAMP domain-containing protein